MHLHEEEVYQMQTPEEIQILEGDRIEFKSVGIDIGSSTSHLMFSRLVLVRRGKEYFSGYTVVEREIIYRSPIILTPYVEKHSRIDITELSKFINQSYAKAELDPSQVDTGAVITTGEAAKKENTTAIIDLLAKDAGKFVCAAAGPSLEAMLAAYGSGAVKYSLQKENLINKTIFNIDVGGGTSKIALIKEGRVLQTAAINIGSRLMAWDKKGMLTRVEEAGRQVAGSLGIEVDIGQKLSLKQRKILADKLAEILFEFILQKRWSRLTRSLMITSGLTVSGPIAFVCYSGGVAEFIYGRENKSFGDLGSWLGQSIRKRHQNWGVELGLPLERICATVIGASQYTVQVSGNTIFLSNPEILPIRNLPVVKLPAFADRFEQHDVVATIKNGFQLLGLSEGKQNVAIAVTWDQAPDYKRLYKFASGIRHALPKTLAAGLPVVLVFDNDVGSLVGHLLSDLDVNPLISIDSINIGQLSYIDIGSRLSTTNAVPVTVKSLIFR